MSIILNIETASEICSVAISKNQNILYSKESFEDKSHASLLAVFINEGMKECQLDYNDLDAVAVSKGPGSYTGLRIGVSTAKGICFGSNKPLIGICTLQTMAFGLLQDISLIEKYNNFWLCPMLDARRMEVFTSFYDPNGKQLSDIKAEIINEDSFKEILDKRTIIFFGNGADKCKDTITHNNAVFIDSIYPNAANMAQLALKAYNNENFENEAYFEPFYLKDFIATVPKKHIYK